MKAAWLATVVACSALYAFGAFGSFGCSSSSSSTADNDDAVASSSADFTSQATLKTTNFLDTAALNWVSKSDWDFVQGGRCVMSCHTTVPFMLLRSKLPAGTGAASNAYATVRGYVEDRVNNWSTVAPLYDWVPDDSRGLEALLNAFALVASDAPTGALSPIAETALQNMWALQKADGSFPWWSTFTLAPWENGEAGLWGTALADLMIGLTPASYTANMTSAETAKLQALEDYLSSNATSSAPLHNRAMILLASSRRPTLLSATVKTSIAAEIRGLQSADGSWTAGSLGFTVSGGTTAANTAHPYATAYFTYVLSQNGDTSSAVTKGRAWLESHQRADGAWEAVSLNAPTEAFNNQLITEGSTVYAALALMP